ncbi:uncharacterized protein isoform X4 [Choristoneura fumiferana]|uniref:uncharacterized protein isoform X4 n=1 Tax=Choristoneura fumiferana TaxID=7141 RepID=UPI003D15BBF5
MEELRSKHKSLHNAAHHIALECINSQSHSPYTVHPYPSPVRLQHAFQNQNSPKMFHPKGLKPHIDGRAYSTPNDSPILGRALCLTPRGSPVPGRVSHLSDKFQDSLTLTSDTDALVAKISAMFPTVSETHIKILLKKYYNREAVVISALQVEKHPITTPGPLTMSPCAAARMQKGVMGVYSALQLAKGMSGSIHSAHLTPLTGTPHGSPCLLRPASGASSYYGARSSTGQPARHQSPKMKLKYLKSVFPKAEETLILDILANKDNNVQKASEELITMGFTKKEIVKKKEETPQPAKKVVTIVKTAEEKNELKQKLQKKYSSVAERVISIALDSVDFNEERAEQILSAVLPDEPPKAKVEVTETRRPRSPEVKPGPILKTSSTGDGKYKSQFAVSGVGPNPKLRRGPKDCLLLEDYMAWKGPNPELRKGQTVKPSGPEAREKSYSLARGPSDAAKGPGGLAKGSMYQKINKKTAKM